MKKILLAGCALCALIGTANAADVMRVPPPAAAVATAKIMGDLSAYGSMFHYSNNDDSSFGGSLFGGLGRGVVYFGPAFSFQLDLNAENVWSEDDDDYSVVNVAGHLSTRNNSFLFGAFGSYGYNGYWGERIATGGVEGMLFLNNVHFYAQGGYSTSPTSSDPLNGWYVHGEGRVFLGPNFMLAGNVGFAHQVEDDTTIDAIRWGLDLEAKMNNSPLGGFVSYRGSRESEPDESEVQYVHAVMLGLKLHFNNPSLIAASKSGATLKDLNPFTGTNHLILNDYQ